MLLVIQNKVLNHFHMIWKFEGLSKPLELKKNDKVFFNDIQYVWNLCMNLEFKMSLVHHPMFMKITPKYFLSIIIQKHYIIGCDKGLHFFSFWRRWFFVPKFRHSAFQGICILGNVKIHNKKILLQILNLSKMKPF